MAATNAHPVTYNNAAQYPKHPSSIECGNQVTVNRKERTEEEEKKGLGRTLSPPPPPKRMTRALSLRGS